MVGFEEMLFDILPCVTGLFLVVYGYYHIYRVARDFFSVAKSWAVSFYLFALGIFLGYRLLVLAYPDTFASDELAVNAGFAVFTAYLSVVIAATNTIYRQYSTVESLAGWLKKNPLNLLTAWGVVGTLSFVWFVALIPTADTFPDDGVAFVQTLFYVLASLLIGVALPGVRRKGLLPMSLSERLRGISVLSVAWVAIPATEILMDLGLERTYGLEEPNPYLWMIVVFFAVIVRTVAAKPFTAMIINPEVEDARKSGFRTYDIPRGVYLIEDDRSASALKLFSELVTLPLRPDAEIPSTKSAADTLEFLIPRGLAVTRDFPEGLRKTYDIQVTPIIWLTESPGDRRIAPTSLALLTDTIIRFMENNPNSIVLLEGVEYLITFNDFKKVLKSLDSLNESTWMSKSRLLIAFNPRAFDVKEVALLERHRTPVRGDSGIEELKKNSTVRASTPS